MSCYNLQPKLIDENSSAEELEYLRNRIKVISGNIIMYREIPVMSTFSCNYVFDILDELSVQMSGDFAFVVDLTEGTRPSKEVRKVLVPRFNKFTGRSKVCCFSVGKNILVKTAVKFLLNIVLDHDYNIVSTASDAIKIANEKLN